MLLLKRPTGELCTAQLLSVRSLHINYIQFSVKSVKSQETCVNIVKLRHRGYFGWLKFSSCRMMVRIVKLYYHIDGFITPSCFCRGDAMLRFHSNSYYANATQCYVTGRLLTLLVSSQQSWQTYQTRGKSTFSRIRSPELF